MTCGHVHSLQHCTLWPRCSDVLGDTGPSCPAVSAIVTSTSKLGCIAAHCVMCIILATYKSSIKVAHGANYNQAAMARVAHSGIGQRTLYKQVAIAACVMFMYIIFSANILQDGSGTQNCSWHLLLTQEGHRRLKDGVKPKACKCPLLPTPCALLCQCRKPVPEIANVP